MSKYADLVLQSNCVFTAAGEEPFAGFVAVAGSKILCVGHGAPDRAILGPNTKVLSLGDRTISPGFTDVHCFFTGYSVGFLGADLSACKTEGELVEAAKAYADTIPAEKSVLCHGWNAQEVPVSGTAPLDEAFGSRPVILFAQGCETCWMNSAALPRKPATPKPTSVCCRIFWGIGTSLFRNSKNI